MQKAVVLVYRLKIRQDWQEGPIFEEDDDDCAPELTRNTLKWLLTDSDFEVYSIKLL